VVLTYRDRQGYAATAAAIGCSVRTLAYMLPAARLANVLDSRDHAVIPHLRYHQQRNFLRCGTRHRAMKNAC
jgi:hypothetical protein